MFIRPVALVWLFANVGSAADLATPQETADLCLQSIQRIMSYDVFLKVGHLSIGENGNEVGGYLSLHQVFSVGRGKRLEKNWEDPAEHSIMIKTWDAAKSGGRVLSTRLTYPSDSDEYFSLYNPTVKLYDRSARPNSETLIGVFLGDVLEDRGLGVRYIDASEAIRFPQKSTVNNLKDLVGIQVSGGGLVGPVNIWIDPEHGYLPSRIEMFVKADETDDFGGKKSATPGARMGAPERIIQVERFTALKGEMWVPVEGNYISVDRDNAGNVVASGMSKHLEIDETRSAWNTIHSDELFLVDSLPVVNHEQNGWKEYYGPNILSRRKEIDVSRLEAASLASELQAKAKAMSASSRRASIRLLLIANVIIIIAFVAILIWRKRSAVGSSR